jgi:hypothetical protein
MEQIIIDPQGNQLEKTIVEAAVEVVQIRNFREVTCIRLPSMKILGLLLHFTFRKYELYLTMRSKGAQLLVKIFEQEAMMSELRLKAE